jgi:hypothetical protein
MRARLRVIPAAVAFATGLAAPALAQDSGASTAAQPVSIAPAPPAGEAVGPAQLKDFSLQGTVTRRAEPPAQPQPRTQASRDAAPAAQSEAAAAPIAERSNRTVERVTPTPAPARAESAPAGGTGLPTPDQTLSFSPATLAPEPLAGSEPAPFESPSTDVSGGFVSHWPWLIALLAALGAAAWYFRRQRSSGYAYASAGGEASSFDFQPAQPAPAPRAQPRPPEPRPVAPAPAPLRVPEERGLSGAVVSTKLKAAPEIKEEVAPAPPSLGIVSTRLRPWLDIEFVPLEATFNDQNGVIQFDVTLFNSGSAPARDILLEARLFNAGADQDEVIEKYFANPTIADDRIDVVQPLKRMTFRTSAKVPREQMRIFEAGGRKVWVPLIGFNAAYRWSGGEGQTSASYLLGRNTNGEKMAPFRVDLGARTFSDLAAHEHTVRLRR